LVSRSKDVGWTICQVFILSGAPVILSSFLKILLAFIDKI
jgi:hypothetical protein